MRIVLDDGATMPTKAHANDAGFDLYSPTTTVIMPESSAIIRTGVHVELPQGTVGLIKSRSGLNIKHGIQTEGVIDVGYTGEICCKLYNHGDDPYVIHKGDRIAQLVITYVVNIMTLEQVDRLDDTDRNTGGFGSTGR